MRRGNRDYLREADLAESEAMVPAEHIGRPAGSRPAKIPAAQILEQPEEQPQRSWIDPWCVVSMEILFEIGPAQLCPDATSQGSLPKPER